MATNDQTTSPFYTSKYGSIKKLTDTNYAVWKGDVTVILEAMNALDIVIGEEEEPPAGNTVAARTAIADYRKRRALATSAIRFSCTEIVAIYINGLSNPREMWETLNQRLDTTTSYIGRTTIVTKFQNARPVAKESIGVYIARLQTYRLQLQGSTEEISDQALLTHVYTTAPPEFKTTIAILKRTAGITIATLTTALKATEEENKAEAAVIDPRSGTGLYARGRGGHRGRGGRGGRGGHGGKGENQDKSCTYCNIDNHSTEDCWKRPK